MSGHGTSDACRYNTRQEVGSLRIPYGNRLLQGLVTRRREWRRWRNFITSADARRVRQALELPPLPRRRRRGVVWGVTLVKNEADIIQPVIEHLFAQGLHGVLVADNMSTDDTPNILRELASSYPLYIARDQEEAFLQGLKMTLLADWARRAGAAWVVPCDADELWFAPEGTVAEFLNATSADVVSAAMHNLFPVTGVEFRHGPWKLEVAPCAWEKVAFRSHPWAILSEGNHRVWRPGELKKTAGLRIVHIPWRSYEQFKRKGRQGARGLGLTGLSEATGFHWRHLGRLEEEGLREVWKRLVQGETVAEIGWTPRGESRLADPFTWTTWEEEGEAEARTGSC